MDKTEKNLYWGYGITPVPRVGGNIRFQVISFDCIIFQLKSEKVEIGPIEEIEQIAPNMSILWTEDAGYLVRWVPKS